MPFGAPRNTILGSSRWIPSGCEAYPFPGFGPVPDVIIHSNEAGGDAEDAADFQRNLEAHQAKVAAKQQEPAPEQRPGAADEAVDGRFAELEVEVAALRAELAALKA